MRAPTCWRMVTSNSASSGLRSHAFITTVAISRLATGAVVIPHDMLQNLASEGGVDAADPLSFRCRLQDRSNRAPAVLPRFNQRAEAAPNTDELPCRAPNPLSSPTQRKEDRADVLALRPQGPPSTAGSAGVRDVSVARRNSQAAGYAARAFMI